MSSLITFARRTHTVCQSSSDRHCTHCLPTRLSQDNVELKSMEVAVAIGKVLGRGQVTLPREIRRAASVRPGDTVVFRVTGPGTIELKTLPRLSLDEALERYHIEGPV